MNKSHETKKRFEEKKFYERLIILLEDQSLNQDKNNKWIFRLTLCSVVIAFLLFWVAFQQMNLENEISDSNKILANVTAQEYGYHQPDVSLVDSYYVKLYIYQINETATKFSFLNLARVYNSAQSDDIALVKPKNIMKTARIPDLGVGVIYIVDNSSGEVLIQQNFSFPPGYTYSIEGLPFPVPVIPGDSPQEIPFFLTIDSTHEKDHESFGFNINDSLEVYHPNGLLMNEINIPTTSSIMYSRGDETVVVKVDNGIAYTIDVRSTDNETTYHNWKNQFLLKYSSSAVTL
ncbi:hypothetical protein [Methanolobus profundi]|uniref:Uncharacterized protein n=1 Tax=Methanolobus profundi TaxID=487685 RepID=A0A1I4T6I2_9EURY|nr:hypothetical protein [Methanolobus profundi]SFM72332.1 hypothetical protein SAMN04488696_2220 [Methanolobus profundi]